MDATSIQQLAARISARICAVCVDRNVDGSCDRLAEGACTLMAKLPLAAEAILTVESNRIDPYVQAIRDNVCIHCDLRDPDGDCAARETDRCMLNCYLPLVVEAIEEYFGRAFARSGEPLPAQLALG